MKYYTKWRDGFFAAFTLALALAIFLIYKSWTVAAGVVLLIAVIFLGCFLGFWNELKKRGLQTELDISRVLGKDAKDALQFGNIGILTYNDEFVCTWESDFFTDRKIDLVNRKLTSWMDNIRDLVDEEVDSVTGEADGRIYEVSRKQDGQLLYVPSVENKKSWGSKSGSKQYYEQRNSSIVDLHIKGVSIDELCEQFHLSYDTIRKIIKVNL